MAPANRPPRGGSRRRGRTRRRPPADYGAYGSVSNDADKDAPRFEPRRAESPGAESPGAESSRTESARPEFSRDDSFRETAPQRDSEGRGSGRRRRGSSRGGDFQRGPERPQPDVTGAFDTEREGPGVAPVDPKGFAKFNLRHELTQALGVMGFEGPRPIQEKALPAGLAGRDVLGLAQTGTGKTAAFVLPILQRLLVDRQPGLRALVVVPTRELATQVHQEFERLGQFTPLSSTAIFGGVPIGRHQRALKARPDVVVACPGRLLDLHNQGMIRMNNVEVLVLDEADHMFDMGFLPDLRRILRTLPPRRQNLMFSATMAKEIRKLADDVLRKPEVVELANTRPAETIDHALYRIAEGEKLDALEDLLSTDDFRSAIVFTRTKHRAKRIAQKLANRGLAAIALQGNMSQAQRERAMKGFRGDTYNVMVATDIAARGLDIEGVSHVVNYDVPVTPDAYTHRIGRTGRSEQVGSAFTFVTPADGLLVKQIEKRLGHAIDRRKIRDVASPVDRSDRPEEEPIENRPPRGGGRGGGFGSRRGGGRGGARGGSRRGGGRGGPRGGGRPAGGGGARPAAAPRQDAAPERKERPSGPGFGAGLAGEAGGPRRTRRRRR